ncbi:MAG TPA: dTMP kinase [Spirochaeta sp.]|nr:dTMP kinase [Spirochaeta sp.]
MTDNYEILEKFIVLEGLDGSGTTTQLNMITKALESSGSKVFATCEPSPLPSGQLIRKVLEKEIDVEPETLARLFSADRHEHLYNKKDGIIKHLNENNIVISDRYLFSSLAYQSLGCGFELVQSLNKYPLPEYLIYLDLSPEVCRERMSSRDLEELFDGESIQMKIIDNYERGIRLFEDSGMKTIRIDGTKPSEQICAEILGVISR